MNVRPTRDALAAAAGKTLKDVVAPGLRVLFCGINPGLYSAYTGHHFARPGNRFWPALHRSGFTPRQFAPSEQERLLELGIGLTNVVARPSATAAELSREELMGGAARLTRLAEAFAPRYIAVLGVTAYRTAFAEPKAQLGEQPTTIGPSRVWVLPNPSGLNAHYTPAALADRFAQLRSAVDAAALS